MKLNNGWVRVYRKMENWEWYQDSVMVHLFIHLLLLANHEQGVWQGVDIQRGQLVTGRKALNRQTGIKESLLRLRLRKLEKSKEITIKRTNKYSIITIVNYELYQKKQEKLTNKDDTNEPNTNQQLTTNKNIKNIKNKEDKYYDDVGKNLENRNKKGTAEKDKILQGGDLQNFLSTLPPDEANLCRVLIDRNCNILSSFQEELGTIRNNYKGVNLNIIAHKIKNWPKLSTKNSINIINGFCERTPRRLTNKENNINKFKNNKPYGGIHNSEITSETMAKFAGTDEERARKTLDEINKRKEAKRLSESNSEPRL